MATEKFYIYAIMDGPTVLYVGKGSGRRSQQSAKKHGGTVAILERTNCEKQAYSREVFWIGDLCPQNNVAAGGGGGLTTKVSKYDVPKALEGVVSKSEWRRSLNECEAEAAEIKAIGSRVYAARFLCRKLDHSNCEQWGVSKVDIDRLFEIAHG